MAGRSLRQAPGDIPAEGVYGKAENSLSISGRLSFTALVFNFAGPGHPMLSMSLELPSRGQNAVAGYHHLGPSYRGSHVQPFAKRFNSFGLAAPLRSAGQKAANGAQRQHGREYRGGEPATELATGCGVRRQRCASDCCSAPGSLLRCVDGTDHISGERPGRSRLLILIKGRSASCALGHREDTGERNTQIIGPRERGAAATGASVAACAATHYPDRPSRASI